jgi:hypothetical protein
MAAGLVTSRREFLRYSAAAAGAAVVLGSCGKRGGQSREVTLYTSVDAYVAQPVVAAYEQQSGVKVILVTDTEATKTLGLVQRLDQALGFAGEALTPVRPPPRYRAWRTWMEPVEDIEGVAVRLGTFDQCAVDAGGRKCFC